MYLIASTFYPTVEGNLLLPYFQSALGMPQLGLEFLLMTVSPITPQRVIKCTDS